MFVPDAERHEPAGHAVHTSAPLVLKNPAAHDVAEPEPAAQKEPDGHVEPVGVDAPTVQKVPALHGFAVALMLPVAVQKPAAHAPVQPLEERPATLPYVPAGHASGVAVPAGQ